MKTLRSRRLKAAGAEKFLRDFLKRVSADEREAKYHKVNTKKLK